MKMGMKEVAAVVGAVLVIGTLGACRNPCSQGDVGATVKEHLISSLKKVDATEAQKTKIGALADQILSDGRQLHNENQGLKTKVADCLLQDTPNREWLHATVDAKAKELTAFVHCTVDRLADMSAVLTGAQRAELRKRFASHHGECELGGGK